MPMDINMPNMVPDMGRRKMIMDAPFEVCPKCGGKYFKEVSMLKKISKLQAGTPEDVLFPIPVFVCDKCGELATSFKEDKKFQEMIGEKKDIEDVTIIK